VEATAFEVEVFNSEIERLTHPQAAGVDQMDNQAGGIAVKIGHVGQELGAAPRGLDNDADRVGVWRGERQHFQAPV